MAAIKKFEDIQAWQDARELVRHIYSITQKAPFSRDFGLSQQVQRAAVSIMSNIAEGFERGGNKEFSQFLSISKASAGEVRSLLYVAHDLKYIDSEKFDGLLQSTIIISKKVSALMRYLKTSPLKGIKHIKP